MDDAAGEGDLAALAVDHVVGLGYALVQCRRIRDELEDGAGLVDIADRVVFEQRGRGVAKVVRIEGGANGESQNLPCVHILHDDGSVIGVSLRHGVIESLLRHELNIVVDGQFEILARFRLMLG